MSSKDPRAQLFANLKCLYGSNVEVLTLCIPDEMYQAVATSFDPFTAKWTKFLHSELFCTSRDAIDALLKVSEKKLAKLLSASGNTVPFQGVMEQTFTLRREGQRNNFISADSMRSDPIVIETPSPTLSDTGPLNFVEEERPVEVPASGESLVDKVEEPAEDNWGSCGVSRTKKNGGKKADPEAPKAETNAEEFAPPEDEWSFGKKKDRKKKGKSDVVVDVAEQIEEPVDDVVPDDDLGWGNFGKKKDKKKKGKSKVVQEPPKDEELIEAPGPEPEEYMGWANAWGKKDKEKRKNTPIEVIDRTPAPDPVPVPPNDSEDDWGPPWGASKNDKKGKGKKSVVEDLAPTPTLPNPPEIESVSDPVSDLKLDGLPAPSPLSPPSPPASESAQLTQTLRVVVFTIELPNELSDKSLQVMTTIANDTRTAIIESVNSYPDLQGIPKGMQVQRKVKIKYGVGRNGHVDVSTLEETMWPQYLDYFRQFTKIPELTLEIME